MCHHYEMLLSAEGKPEALGVLVEEDRHSEGYTENTEQ